MLAFLAVPSEYFHSILSYCTKTACFDKLSTVLRLFFVLGKQAEC
jgi:hypothetical protein